MSASGGEGGIRTPGTGFSPVQQISNLPCSATPAPLRGGDFPDRDRLFGGPGLVSLAQPKGGAGGSPPSRVGRLLWAAVLAVASGACARTPTRATQAEARPSI